MPVQQRTQVSRPLGDRARPATKLGYLGAVGPDNFFLFGLTAQEVHDLQRTGYRPRAIYERDARLKEVIDLIAGGFFSSEDPNLFRPMTDALLDNDTYMLFADFDAYVACQQKVSEAFTDKQAWHAMAVRNIAQVGVFSSDRTIREYATEIWHAQPVKVELRDGELDSFPAARARARG